MVCLLWSESVDEFVNLEFFPLDLDSFHTEKNSSAPKCIATKLENVLSTYWPDAFEAGARK